MIEEYNKDWFDFKKAIELKAKGRCVINNKNWLKLKDYHFKKFIKEIPKPYFVLFKMIHLHKIHKKIPCAYRVYTKHKRIVMQEDLNFRNKSKASAFKKYR